MSYYVYGLRIVGDLECRYVGATKHLPKSRLSELTSAARERAKSKSRQLHPDGLYGWLLSNHGNIDAFKIGKVETGIEARAMEKAIIALVLLLGHRLLNVAHVPDERRIGYVRTGSAQRSLDRREARKARAA